jgi:hypothetical protein
MRLMHSRVQIYTLRTSLAKALVDNQKLAHGWMEGWTGERTDRSIFRPYDIDTITLLEKKTRGRISNQQQQQQQPTTGLAMVNDIRQAVTSYEETYIHRKMQ